MNLNLIRPRNQTEDLLFSTTKNCETLIDQIRTRPQETFEFEVTKPRQTFHFNPNKSVERFSDDKLNVFRRIWFYFQHNTRKHQIRTLHRHF